MDVQVAGDQLLIAELAQVIAFQIFNRVIHPKLVSGNGGPRIRI